MATTAQADRYLAAHGDDVTLTTYTEGAVDSYGDPADSTTSSTIRAARDAGPLTQDRTVRNADGQETVVDQVFFVADDVAIDDDPASGRAPEITTDSEIFQVLYVRPEGPFQRVLCRRMTQ